MHQSSQTIIFLHIPKTAGTTLHSIIERQYPPENVFSLGAVAQESIEEYKNMSVEERAKIRMLKGHMGFGLHRLVPGTAEYFTLLRDPIERVLSFYYFVRRTPAHYLSDFVTSEAQNLKEFIRSGVTAMVDNAQTRMLSGVWLDVEVGGCTEELLAIAKRNLREHFVVVGLTERFDETLILLKRQFGWGKLLYTRRNVTVTRPTKNDVSRDTLTVLRETNQLDIALYEYATTLFDEQVRRQGPLFPVQVKALQYGNRLYQLARESSVLLSRPPASR